MYAEPSTRLYTIADLSRVWVNAQVFQNDVGRLKPGNPAEITVDAYPQKIFHGRVEEVLPQVDMTTRTVQVRLSIDNSGLLLKPGMFVNVQLSRLLAGGWLYRHQQSFRRVRGKLFFWTKAMVESSRKMS